MNLDRYDWNRTTLSALAKVGVLTILFQKKDYTNRKMICTLMPAVIRTKVNDPAENAIFNKGEYTPFRIFDLELDEWRSFIPSRIISAVWETLESDVILKKYPIIKTRPQKVLVEMEVPKGSLDYVTLEHIKKALLAVGYKITTIQTPR